MTKQKYMKSIQDQYNQFRMTSPIVHRIDYLIRDGLSVEEAQTVAIVELCKSNQELNDLLVQCYEKSPVSFISPIPSPLDIR